MGKIIKIDLSTGKQETVEVDDNIRRKYLGGRGLGVKLYTEICSPQTEPLSPQNVLIFLTGPLTGIMPTSGRFQVISRSPLTNTICDSSSGGIFGAELKKTGLDGFIVTGKAAKPVYLNITDDGIEIRNATHLWGLNTQQTKEAIIKETKAGSSVASIGPAGENQVLFAAIMNDKDRAAGRGGMGAVMGFKNLKAVVVKGTGKILVNDPDALKAFLPKLDRLMDCIQLGISRKVFSMMQREQVERSFQKFSFIRKVPVINALSPVEGQLKYLQKKVKDRNMKHSGLLVHSLA
jgi:aldehyde:ferredoxin oxidoreductase